MYSAERSSSFYINVESAYCYRVWCVFCKFRQHIDSFSRYQLELFQNGTSLPNYAFDQRPKGRDKIKNIFDPISSFCPPPPSSLRCCIFQNIPTYIFRHKIKCSFGNATKLKFGQKNECNCVYQVSYKCILLRYHLHHYFNLHVCLSLLHLRLVTLRRFIAFICTARMSWRRIKIGQMKFTLKIAGQKYDSTFTLFHVSLSSPFATYTGSSIAVFS